jgi:hypothetical protein
MTQTIKYGGGGQPAQQKARRLAPQQRCCCWASGYYAVQKRASLLPNTHSLPPTSNSVQLRGSPPHCQVPTHKRIPSHCNLPLKQHTPKHDHIPSDTNNPPWPSQLRQYTRSTTNKTSNHQPVSCRSSGPTERPCCQPHTAGPRPQQTHPQSP